MLYGTGVYNVRDIIKTSSFFPVLHLNVSHLSVCWSCFQTSAWFFLVLGLTSVDSHVGPQGEIGHLACHK